MAMRPAAAPALSPVYEPYRAEAAPLAGEHFEVSDEDIEEFQDANDQHSMNAMDLQTAFNDCEVAIRKFFNNDLDGANKIMKPWDRTSLYHSLGTCMFEFIPAMLTFDRTLIHRTLDALKRCISICNQHRRRNGFVEAIGGMIIRKETIWTDLEAHAELCYAEALLLQAATVVMGGEDLTWYIKGTIKIKTCFSSYKECAKILEKKTEWMSEQSKIHFQSGVRLGMATFNVMISLLPPRVISVLEFVGFTSNKNLGLAELEAASLAPGMRSVLCDLTLLSYHLVACHFTGAPIDLTACERILDKQLQVYPDSVWFLVFKGRNEFVRGQFDSAIETYHRAATSQIQWQQFHHVCHWEIMWVNGLKMSWRASASYAWKLMEESSWSKTIYSYTRAAMLLELDDITYTERKQCIDLMRNTSYYKQRIAGKSLPMEKFVIKRAARYQAQGRRLIMPGIELLCLFNMFQTLAKNEKGIQKMLKLIQRTIERVESERRDWMGVYEADNRALMRFLEGSCLAAMNLNRLALDTFDTVLQLKNEIKEDTFLIPYTVAEMAMCHYQLGHRDRALKLLLDARKKYSGYSLESRLHFRLHAKLEIVKNDGTV